MDSSRDSFDASSASQELRTDPLSILSKTIKQSKIFFIGTYLERRYVDRLQLYRDIVTVDNNEQELFKCLDEVRKIALQECGTEKWIGITCDIKDDSTQNYNLWVELEGIPFGSHWFQLRSIKVKDQSIQLHLKYLRAARQSSDRRSFNIDDYPMIDYRELLTYDNICGTFRFLLVFAMSLVALSCNALWYLADYSIKITHELSGVIRALTPILFGIIDFFSKCVGGFYWLVYMLWRGDSTPSYQIKPPMESNKRRSNIHNRRAICYE